MKCWTREEGENLIRRVLREGKFRRGGSKICSRGTRAKVRSKIWVGDAKFGGWAARNLVGGQETLLAVGWMMDGLNKLTIYEISY